MPAIKQKVQPFLPASQFCADLQIPNATIRALGADKAGQGQEIWRRVHLGMVWTQGAALACQVLRPCQRDGDWLAACSIKFSHIPLPSADLLAEIPEGSLGGAEFEASYFSMLRREIGSLLENMAHWPEMKSEETELRCGIRMDAESLYHLVRVLCATDDIGIRPEKKNKFITQIARQWHNVQLPSEMRALDPCLDEVRDLLTAIVRQKSPEPFLQRLRSMLPALEKAVKQVNARQ